MKKFAIGCAIVLALGAVAVSIGLYWAYSKAKDYVGALNEAGQVAGLDEQVTNKAAFTPPGNGEVTQEQLTRFVAMNEAVQAELGQRFQQLKAKYDEMEARMKQEQRDANPAEALSAIKDFAGIMVDVRKAQVNGLNAQNMSVEEYRWLRDQAYAAVGVPIAAFNIGQFVEAAQSGDTAAIERSMKEQSQGISQVAETNRALFEPHEEKLKEWAALAWLGF